MTKYCIYCAAETEHCALYGIEREPVVFVYERNNETIERGNKANVYYCSVCGIVHVGIASAPVIEETTTETTIND